MSAPMLPASPSAPMEPAPAVPGTEASRALLGGTTQPRPITLWGSSSMSSEGGAEATPLPIRIHEHLALAAAPAVVHPFGVGATQSAHALLMRGLDEPHVTPQAPVGDGAVAVQLDSALPARGPLRCRGEVDGVVGTLDATSGSWRFVADDASAALGPGTFRSALSQVAADARQVLWLGKNNILDTSAVLDHTQRMWDAAARPEDDTLVLGHWPTANDPTGSATGDALTEVNDELTLHRAFCARWP